MHLYEVRYGSIKQTFRAPDEHHARSRMVRFLGIGAVGAAAYMQAFKVKRLSSVEAAREQRGMHNDF